MKKFDFYGQVVIMCGISGSGKTHFAKTLEDKGYIRLSSDKLIWERIGPELFNLSPSEQKLLFDQCKKQLLEQFDALIKAGEKVVLDATHCRRDARNKLRILCSNSNVQPVFVYCEAEEEELWQRLSQRKGEGPDDLIVTREQLSEYWKGFQRPEEDETDFIFLK